jgi:tryptophan synthase beta subunit
MKKNYDVDFNTYFKEYPNEEGYFGRYGGAFLPPELIPAFKEITEAYQTICHSAQFINELRRIRKEFQGRPTPVYHCERLSRMLGTTQIYLKREDLNHTGAHKLNHCMGGAMDLVVGAKKVIISMLHTQKGKHKILNECTLPYTAINVVDMIVTEMGVMEVTPEGLVLTEINEDYTVEQVQEATQCKLIISPNLKKMEY